MTVSARLALLGARLFEGRDAVRDGFDAGHRSAAAGECFEQKPDGEVLHGGGQRRRRRGHGDGMAVRRDAVPDADGDRDEQRADEEHGGQHEDEAGLFDAAQVHDDDEREDEQAECELVRMQSGNCADQSRDAGGDSYRGGQDVVDHERGSGEQAGIVAEVFAGDSEGASAVRIRVDRLAVAEVEDGEQNEDGAEDWDQVLLHADEAERHKQRHRLFGAVSSAGQAIEPEDGNACGDANVFMLRLAGGQRLSNEQIEQVQVWHSHSTSPVGGRHTSDWKPRGRKKSVKTNACVAPGVLRRATIR